MSVPTLTCDVCNKEPAEGVACVPGVPMSVAYGAACLKANAHPWWVLVANTVCCGGLDNTHSDWKQMVQDTCTHLGRTLEQFNKEVAEELEKLEKEMQDD